MASNLRPSQNWEAGKVLTLTHFLSLPHRSLTSSRRAPSFRCGSSVSLIPGSFLVHCWAPLLSLDCFLLISWSRFSLSSSSEVWNKKCFIVWFFWYNSSSLVLKYSFSLSECLTRREGMKIKNLCWLFINIRPISNRTPNGT